MAVLWGGNEKSMVSRSDCQWFPSSIHTISSPTTSPQYHRQCRWLNIQYLLGSIYAKRFFFLLFGCWIMLSTLWFWDQRLKSQESAVPISRKRIVLSSVIPSDEAGFPSAWARIWRSTRLVSTEWIIRSALVLMSSCLKLERRCLQY